MLVISYLLNVLLCEALMNWEPNSASGPIIVLAWCFWVICQVLSKKMLGSSVLGI